MVPNYPLSVDQCFCPIPGTYVSEGLYLNPPVILFTEFGHPFPRIEHPYVSILPFFLFCLHGISNNASMFKLSQEVQ